MIDNAQLFKLIQKRKRLKYFFEINSFLSVYREKDYLNAIYRKLLIKDHLFTNRVKILLVAYIPKMLLTFKSRSNLFEMRSFFSSFKKNSFNFKQNAFINYSFNLIRLDH